MATRVADAFALLPANDTQIAEVLFMDLIKLGDEGLAMVTNGVRPAGDERGLPHRYAVALLTHYAVTPAGKAKVEVAYLAALPIATNTEVKIYFIENLALVGSDQSVGPLALALQDTALAATTIGTLEAIGSKQASDALRVSLSSAPAETQRIVKALGRMRDVNSVEAITKLVNTDKVELRRQALWALALIADAGSQQVLVDQARSVNFKADAAGSMEALIEYMNKRPGDPSLQKIILDNTLSPDQQHFRLAALQNFVASDPVTSQKFLLKELNRFDVEYRREVLKRAGKGIQNPTAREAWTKQYQKSTGEGQAEILQLLADGNADEAFADRYLIPALSSKNPQVRIVSLQQLALTRKKKYADAVASCITKSENTSEEMQEAKSAFLQLADQGQVETLAKKLEGAKPMTQVTILQILATRRDVKDFAAVFSYTSSLQSEVRTAAFSALPFVASASSLNDLLKLLVSAQAEQEVKDVQQALIAIAGSDTAPDMLKAVGQQKLRMLPVLPYLKDPGSFGIVKSLMESGVAPEKEAAFSALLNWQNGDAAATLLAICRDENRRDYHARAFTAFVRQVMNTEWPADQKLLKLREIMPLARTTEERRLVIREAGNVRTFLSLIFVSSYLDDPDHRSAASWSTMRLALPTADAQPGMTGMEVRQALEKVMSTLTGPDSQYDRIDVKTYLDNLTYTEGFVSIFNGKDLTGWKGLVENPIARAKMTKAELAQKQAVADKKRDQCWTVKDGVINFNGEFENLCTIRSYSDFEMIVDFKIPRGGDSGIYLRGTPQVQIWDIARVADGAQVGSGGLYNNTVNRNPLVVADNPVSEWNTLRITMIGERVTVYLNGVLTVDNVVMENYWDRKLPIFAEDAIELQAHGPGSAFRNIYVRELHNKPFVLPAEEKAQGYEVLFDGRDLSNWVGNKVDYVVEDQCIAIYPAKGGRGNLYTSKEYSDFIFKFEFQLTPASNNGLGIHAPLEGDAAYVGKELQILDDGHPAYAGIQPYQAHGSVYGIIAAKRGFLKPTGEWNQEEVEVKGDWIKITLNGMVIVDADMKKASENGTIDKHDHPGLNRHLGHIGFLGHGSVVRFRKIRIKSLK